MPSYRKSRYTGAAGTTPTVMQSVRRVEFLIPKAKTGAVMGQGGENIRRITEKSGANITYDRKAATPTHAVFVLQGKWNDVIRASELISESAGVQGTMKGVDPGLSRGGGGAGMRGYDDSRDMVPGREAGAYGRNAPRSALSGPSAAQPSQSYGEVADRVYSDYVTRLHNNGANPYRGGPSADDDNRLLNVAARGNLGGPGGRSSDHLRKDIQQLENLLDRYDSGAGRMDRGGQYGQGMGGRDAAPYAAGRDTGFGPEGREGMKRRMEDWGRQEVPDKRQRMGAEAASWGSGTMGRMDARMEEQRRMEERRRLEEQRRMEEQRRVEEMRQREEQRRLEEQRRMQQQQPSFEEERRRRGEEQRRMQEMREERQRMEQRSRMEMELMEQRRKLEEQRRQEQQRLLDQQRMFEQQRQEEERLLAIERRRLEEQKMLEEQRLAEERRRTEMAQVQLMEERRMVEQQYANLARMQESIQMQPPMMDRDMMPRGDPMHMGGRGEFMPMNRPPMDRPPMEGPFGINMMGPRMDRGMRPPGPPGMRGGMQPPLGRGRRPGLPPRMGPLAKRLSPSQLSVLAEKVQRFKYGLMRFPKRGTIIQAMKNILIRSKCKLALNFAINQIKRGNKTELEGILTLGDIILAQTVGSKEKAVRIAAYRDAMKRMKMLSPRDIVMSPNPPVNHLSAREEDEILATRPNVINKKQQAAADDKSKASSEATPDKKASEEAKGEEGSPAKKEEGASTKDKDAADGKEGSSKPAEQSPDKPAATAAKAGQAAATPAKPEAKSAPQGKTAAPTAKPAPGKQAPTSAPAKTPASTPAKTPASTPAKTAATPASTPAKPKRAEHACDELLGVGDKLEQFRQELLSPASGAETDVMKAFNKLAQEHEISMAFIFLRDTPEGEKPQNLACELYLEDLFVASAQGPDKKSSKTAAYEAALAKLKPDDAISLLVVEGRRLKYEDIRRTSLIDYVYMNHSPEVEGLDTETNTSQLKRMGLYPVNENLSANSFVFVESDNPKQPVNLKTMAAINGMNFKLEVTTNMSRPAGKRHKCDVFIQDKLIATAFMSSKKMAKQIGCENALKALNTSKHNVIKYLPLQDMKSLQTEATVMAIATKMWKTKGDGKGDATLTPQTDGYDKWVEAAVQQIMENYIKQVTLDLLPFAPELPAAVHTIISRVAQRHGFVYVQSPGSKYYYVQKNRQRRSAREICHLLQMIPGGRSGRYKLMREASSLSQQQRDKVKELYFANKEIFV